MLPSLLCWAGMEPNPDSELTGSRDRLGRSAFKDKRNKRHAVSTARQFAAFFRLWRRHITRFMYTCGGSCPSLRHFSGEAGRFWASLPYLSKLQTKCSPVGPAPMIKTSVSFAPFLI